MADGVDEAARRFVETEALLAERDQDMSPANLHLGIVADETRIARLQRHVAHRRTQLRQFQFFQLADGILYIDDNQPLCFRRLWTIATRGHYKGQGGGK